MAPQNFNYLGDPAVDCREWVGSVPATVRSSTADYATATHAAAVITIPAPASPYSVVLSGVAWSYSGGTPAGSITVADGGNTVFSQDISAAGLGSIAFNPPRRFSKATAVVVTLSDGGASVVGKVNVLGRYTDMMPPMETLTLNVGELFDFSQFVNSQYIPVLAL